MKNHDLSSLRHVLSVGEPLNAEVVRWGMKVYGKRIHDNWWMTETGHQLISNYPSLPMKPGSMGKPFPGITATVIHPETYEPFGETGKIGLIAIKPGWPSMMRTYWNNEETYKKKFRNGWYLPGDRSSIDNEGYFWFVGRDDDVINTGGHLVSPFEVESALLEHPAVAESAVVSKPDFVNIGADSKGHGLEEPDAKSINTLLVRLAAAGIEPVTEHAFQPVEAAALAWLEKFAARVARGEVAPRRRALETPEVSLRRAEVA